MSVNTSNKRKCYFNSTHPNKKQKGNTLTVGLKGFLCTCNGRTRDCTREAYNVLNEYADKLYPEKKNKVLKDPEERSDSNDTEKNTEESKDSNETIKQSSGDKEEDICDSLENELQELKEEKKKNLQRFQFMDPGVNGCVFISTTLENPVELAYAIMKDVQKEKQSKTKFLLRMVPVEVICKAYMDDITKAAEKLVESHFIAEPKTFAIVLNRRNNNNVDRDKLVESLANLVKETNSDCRADLKNPQVSIVVEVMKSLCLMSVVPEYNTLRKYNLVELGNSKETPKTETS